MRVVLSQRLSEGFKKIVPEISILFLIILSVQPQSVLGNSVISPFLCLSAVFYWSLHRQGHFYVVTLIILGIISGYFEVILVFNPISHIEFLTLIPEKKMSWASTRFCKKVFYRCTLFCIWRENLIDFCIV